MIKRLLWLYRDLKPHNRAFGFVMLIIFLILDSLARRSTKEPIWLIGEARGDCLMENGYHFFRYCRSTHPEQRVYFVVNRTSPHYDALAVDPNVLRYGSARHIDTYIKASICFYTHTYCDFIFREQFLIYRGSKRLVFLHHGVLGFKKFNTRYAADRNIMDLFTVGSALERDILLSQADVAGDKVKVTGYARYDAMADMASRDKLQIAYIPTHRNWLKVPTGRFRETDFYQSIDRFINDPALHDFLALNHVTLKVYLHAVMKVYSSQFESRCPWVKIIAFGDEGPQQLICESHLLITDYSSVAWDFIYLGKPVLFYRFDMLQYLASRGSYLPLDKPIFGEVLFNAPEVVAAIKKYRHASFTLRPVYKTYRNNIMPLMDHNNSERIFALVDSLPG